MFWKMKDIDEKRVAAIDNTDLITYGDVKRHIEEIQSITAERNVVLILSDNSVGSYLGYICFLYMNCAVILLENTVKEEFCKAMIEKYRPKFVWAQEKWRKLLDFPDLYKKYGFYLLRTGHETYTLNEKVGVILSTSGSTGNVKCVQLGYEGIQEHAKALGEVLEFTENDSIITTMPMAFVYTLSFINICISKGATVLLTNSNIMERDFWSLFHKYHPTCISGLTVHYEMLSVMKLFEKNCQHLRILTQGGDVFGEKMRVKVTEYCRKYHKKGYILYGQTETSGTCGALSFFEDKETNCIGKAISSGSFEIENIECGQGELIYNGKCAMLGYATGDLDLTELPNVYGRVETGDIVRRDTDGCYYIVGRKKRFIKLYGKRVNLDDIENYVKKQFGVQECVCVGEKEKVWVILTEQQHSDAVLKEGIKNFLGISDTMIRIEYVDSMIKNESGKISYFKLEEMVRKMNEKKLNEVGRIR